MKKMKIGTRLTLLYTGLLFLLLTVIFAAFYGLFSKELHDSEAEKIQEYARYVADEIELDDGMIDVDLEDDDLYDIVRNGLLSVYAPGGELIFSNHQTTWLDAMPRQDGQPRRVQEGYRWLVYDRGVREDGREIAWLRMALPLEAAAQTESQMRNVLWLLLPICVLCAVLSGMWISRKVLRPIQQVTQTAREISQGDLSKRMDFPAGEDEIAALGATFDQMLDSLEGAYNRERQFSSDASHELRTPLAVILAQAEAGLAEEEAEEQRTALEAIACKARDMQRMLSQLLMLARGYEGSHRADMCKTNLSAVVEDLTEEMLPMAAKRNIRIQRDIQQDLYMNMDLMLFTQMLMNLLDNAIKYGKEGGRIKISLQADGERALRLQVADDGQGISEEDLPHIFDRFYRSDKARTGGGFGLGLSIVLWIVDLHGGRISAQSREGEGTAFSLSFPSVRR